MIKFERFWSIFLFFLCVSLSQYASQDKLHTVPLLSNFHGKFMRKKSKLFLTHMKRGVQIKIFQTSEY